MIHNTNVGGKGADMVMLSASENNGNVNGAYLYYSDGENLSRHLLASSIASVEVIKNSLVTLQYQQQIYSPAPNVTVNDMESMSSFDTIYYTQPNSNGNYAYTKFFIVTGNSPSITIT